MSTYAVGDIQGCLAPLQQLLKKVNFDPAKDRLWVAGDMINRGPDSLGTLRLLSKLDRDHPGSVCAVLGNHDLHFLAVYYGLQQPGKGDTLAALLAAPDCDELVQWLRRRPLLHNDSQLGFTMVHAGIPPQWDLDQAAGYAAEVEKVLRDDKRIQHYLEHMYGNQPSQWEPALDPTARLRLITNYFTRMRYCSAAGQLELSNKTAPTQDPTEFTPWFSHPGRKTREDRLIFGHWAALEGRTDTANTFALDTGCVWGGQLTFLRLEDATYFRCACPG